MSLLLNGDCLEELKNIEDKKIDLIFCDLPYGQTSCKWDSIIDLEKLWKEFMRIKKLNTPIIMTCTTKFGVSLIQSAPKKCPFRYDLIWCKSAPCGFLSAKKMPMRKHEMIYVFYEKLPLYDLSSHKHKFIKEDKGTIDGNKVYEGKKVLKREPAGKYEPPLPTSLVKEEMIDISAKTLYGDLNLNQPANEDGSRNKYRGQFYEPPLPTSLVKEDVYEKNKTNDDLRKNHRNKKYEPPLPDSLLEIKSTRGKHSTEKPVDLMKWILKYYSKEDDYILDPTMGSGSMGVGCNEMKRNFIGIEKDEQIFNVATNRINLN